MPEEDNETNFLRPDPDFDAVNVLESIGDACYILDHEWRFTYLNHNAEFLVRRTREELLGKVVWDEFPEAVGSGFDIQYRRAIAEQTPVFVEEFYPPLDTWFEVRAYPFSQGLSVFFHNITARKQAQEALLRSQEDLRLAVDAAHLGTFYCDWPLDKIIWNDTCKEHFFLPADAEVDFALFYSLLHPDDREPTRQAIERAMIERVEYDVEYRTLAADGRTRWVNAVGRFYYDSDGNPIRFDGITIDISERRRAQNALRASEEALRDSDARLRDAQARLEAALKAGEIATWNFDLATDTVVADANLARLFSVSPEDAAGGSLEAYLRAIHPGDRPRVVEAIADAIAHREVYQAEYRVVLPDGSLRWLATRGKVERNSEGKAVALPGVVLDVTERVEREQREQFLAELAERARGLLDPDEVIADAVRSVGEFFNVARCVFADIDIEIDACTIPIDYCANESVASMAGTFPISAFGPFLVGEYAAGRTVVADDVRDDIARFPIEHVVSYNAVGCRAFIAVPVLHSARLVSVVAIHNTAPRHWTHEEVQLLQAVVERTWLTVEVLRKQRALDHEAMELRAAHEHTATILESITDAFYAIDGEWRFSYLNAQAAQLLHRTRDELIGRGIWDAFPEAVGSAFYHLFRRAMDEQIPVSVEDYYAPLDSWMDVRVYPSATGLSVFFQNVNARKRAEEERERLLAEQRARAEREALLNRIGHVLRQSTDTEAAQETAAALLGEALGADRCYFAIYDLTDETVRIARDWRRSDLPSVQGTHLFANTAEMFRELYQDSHASIISDAHASSLSAQTRANMTSLQLRSRVSVALADTGGLATTLTAAMADQPRDWTAEEVKLVEAVATQLRMRVEEARLQQREHRIATQLQEALQPELPANIPGLSVGKFTKAALDEANVGGDFYDIFAIDKELYACVIADVSGKGLAAAQQLALIRNTLRTTLYLHRTPAQASASLNAIVTSYNLLVGFVTAWVGVYDVATGQITFCSCGHEPGLVRRADGSLETLATTGPPLGVAEHAEYGEQTVTLCSGDNLLLYTDGISESGSSRRELLGTTGLTRLFGDLSLTLDVQADVEALVGEVSALANGVFRDDVAVLLARRL